ncbi:MAG TPA: hypothetical protein VIG51_01955 [Candidatus Baltobacteraceae bacterium]|jgi:hypothetical protein
MAALEQIRSAIADFDGYGDEESRRRSDQLIRSYLGERLAAYRSEHGDSGAFDALVLRCEFMDQRIFKAFESSNPDRGRIDALLAADLEVVALAGRTAALGLEDLPGFVNASNAALDRRDAAMRG